MVNLYYICDKPINSGDWITVNILTRYGYVPETNEFRTKLNSVQFFSDSMAHLDCTENEEGDE